MINLLKSFVLLLVTVGLIGCDPPISEKVIQGELDLENWSGKQIDLIGEWRFYWGEYSGAASDSIAERQNLISVPSEWNSLADSLKWKAFGQGVYQLHVRNVPEEQLALKIPSRVFCSYRLLVDGTEIARTGQTGFDIPYEPEQMTKVIPLPTGKREMEIAIEVANYSQRRGGILGPPELGMLTNTIANSWLRLLPEIIAITIILVVSFIGFNLYALDRSNKLHLYLGILGVASILRQLTIGKVLYKLIWPDGSYEVFELLRHGGLLVSLAVSARFLRVLYDKHANSKLLMGMEGLYYALGLLIPITAIWLNSYLTLIAQPVALLMMGYSIYLGIRYRRDYPKVEWLITGTLVVIFVFSHDILIASLRLQGAYLQSYGMSFFIVCYAIYVNKRSQSIKDRHSALARQLTEMSVLSSKKKELDGEVAETLKQLRPILDRYEQGKTNELIQEIKHHQSLSERQSILQQTLLESNEQFLDNLHRRFPNLTRSEEEICLLFRAKLSTKEIAQARKITVDSAKVARKRLRKKLKLEPDQDIYQFIASI